MGSITGSITLAAVQTFLLSASTKIIYSVIILFISSLLISVLNKIAQRILDSRLSQLEDRKEKTILSVFGSMIKVAVYFIAGSSILTQFGVNVGSILAVAGVGSVAIAFGAQSLVKDVITGCFILIEDQYGVGDIITIAGVTGQVTNISLRTTTLRNFDGTLYVVPNGSVTIVESKSKQFMNAMVDVNIAYTEDINKVLEILNDEMDKAYATVKGLRAKPEVLGIMALAESALSVRIIAECQVGLNYPIERTLRLLIKNRLDAEGIKVPYSQHTIHIEKGE